MRQLAETALTLQDQEGKYAMKWLARLFSEREKVGIQASGQAKEMVKLPRGCVPADNGNKRPGDAGYVVTHERTGLQLVWVPGTGGLTGRSMHNGCFLMGSVPEEIDKQWRDNGWNWDWLDYPEQPRHPVELSPFWIARTEVTNAIFARFVEDSRYDVEDRWSEYYVKGRGNYPAVCLTRNDAKAFCDWAGLQLPTEAQWEWAAAGPEGHIYPWGDNWNRVWCNNLELHAGPLPTTADFDRYIRALNIEAEKSGQDGEASDITLTARSLRPAGSLVSDTSWCGAMDMAGSVQEWCLDFYDSYYYQTSAKRDPAGPDKGSVYALRGGCWSKVAPFCRCANRGMDIAKNAHHGRGFRPSLRAE